ncbi:MAG: 3-deoxy-manno-octulosonate cytidylyltransferase [Candidatus Omnitrophica bacterium]|nr:3-deoxy-manno-octulosonate cytidylyltransferase [Candidatus Omnitrophota bacterium]
MIIGIIPARMSSSRFPGKPLAKILGIPMVGHVYFRSKMCKALDEVYVATCDKEIYDYISSVGGKAVMTSDKHQRASDRAAEAMLKIELDTGKKTQIAVMIQGDEPMLVPEMITNALKPFSENSTIQVVNLMAALSSKEEWNDPHEIKVVCDLSGFALYFSREPIPSCKKDGIKITAYKQVCIIPFKRDFLIKFNELKSTPLEQVESVDMLRLLEHGYKVKMVFSGLNTYSVDTSDDLKKVEKLIENDELLKAYLKYR